MIKAKSHFKKRSTANNVQIIIPVPNDADSPTFKVRLLEALAQNSKFCVLPQTVVGHCKYAPEKSAIVWTIKQFPGGKEFLMKVWQWEGGRCEA